ncbi:aminotransferase class I/II-fold pyridoxal phosphate-dependent enzyme [Clostridium niameyense]|uniref:aminotransferase class I/II-fold pyridoxal phosphate-dependent enzyme n=1 Tax=Clostridium niameyense TaxID=1622073 RepID=UPI00067F7346|nr:aminotransferase class V-fold PLP-dependent enzyme [Clostridium niameyense]
MSKLPIIKGVLKYIEENNLLFSMPGHKGGAGFLYTKEGKSFMENIIKYDLTEVDGLDNLHNSEGIIKESGNLLSRLYNSKKSYFLVNGSTSGNLAMIFSAFKEGDKVIVERNCHRSIFNGIVIRKLKPIYIKNKIYDKFNAPLAIDLEHFLLLIEENKDAKGIIITYPNYYGICPNLQLIINKAKECGMKVLVDSAHGAHFVATDKLPEDALKLGADMVVMSAHKTLPSLTQTAFLHIGKKCDIDINKVDFFVSLFLSTSPSYIFLCSMEYSRFYLDEYGKDNYNKFIKLCERYRIKINSIPNFHVIGEEDKKIFNYNFQNVKYIDPTRYVINLNNGLSGYKLLDYLRENKIQCEMADSSNIVLILSPFYREKEMEKLYNCIKNCDCNSLKSDEIKTVKYLNDLNNQQKLLPFQVIDKDSQWIDIKESVDKINYNSIVPYPPGVPIIMPGELITKEIVDAICYYIYVGIDVLGIQNNKIQIIK